jgi:hypothetical protein
MYTIIESEFKGGLKGDALLLDTKKIRAEYKYLGIWYARDGSDATLITTEIYRADGKEPAMPEAFSEEIKENSFKQARRIELSIKNDRVWVAARIDGGDYCSLRADSRKSGHTYLNYKTIRTKGTGFEVLDKGVFKGGGADFFRLGVEDRQGPEDFSDTILYVVLVKDLPPADWKVDQSCLGIQNVPVLVPVCTFTADRKYSDWMGQNPLMNSSSKG